jgi:hypothetical protein
MTSKGLNRLIFESLYISLPCAVRVCRGCAAPH